MNGTYAHDTTVPPERSRQEIESTLRRYGATAFSYGWQEHHALVMFEAHGRRVRFDLTMPKLDDPEFRYTPQRRLRSEGSRQEAHDQAVRQRWRALALVIKAKLEAVELGLVEFEDEFLANVVVPNSGGETVGQWMRPQLERAYRTGQLPAMLPGLDPDEPSALALPPPRGEE